MKKRFKVLDWGGGAALEGVGRCWVSPDGRYGVAEVSGQDFAIGSVVADGPEVCTLRLLERYCCPAYDEASVTLFTTTVEWSWMRYGFFKVVSSDWDTMEDTVHRFYFDRALYCRERERLRREGQEA